MTQMMQSMRWLLLECYKFNALLILLTLISHDRFSMVFGITVNPLESLVSSASSYGSDEYSDTGDGPNEFDAEVHDLNNIDISQFTAGYTKIADSEETADIGPYTFGSTLGDLNQKIIIKDSTTTENQSDNFNELLRVFSIHHSTFEVPNFFNNRISIKSRFVSKPTTQFRPKIIRPAASPLSAITDGIKDRLKAIYPGTLWCGDGTHAKNQNEIGLFRNTDICCKQHDECPAFIKAGSEFKGLRNTGLFTRSHCDCDLKFYNCLKRTGTLISGKIGYTYFNILRPQCFRKEYPIVGCKKWNNNKCLAYTVDDKQQPVWQWFENKLF